jgi:hypothetical protein
MDDLAPLSSSGGTDDFGRRGAKAARLFDIKSGTQREPES